MQSRSAKNASSSSQVAPLALISLRGARELGDKIKDRLDNIDNMRVRYPEIHVIENHCPRFSSGDAKGVLDDSVRGYDVYIIVDVGNYSCTYKMFGFENHMSPDDHFQDLKRIIHATMGKARRINLVMPILYGSRQHRRNFRESLDCAGALQELKSMGVSNIISFDTHDARVCNAVPLMGIDNVIPSYQLLKALFKKVDNLPSKINNGKFMVVSPDEGAVQRNEYYASVLGADLGMFYKRRNYQKIVNGRNPIVAHEYLGDSVKGKVVLISDDIISSGESMLDVARELKRREADKIIAYATYPIFTSGFEAFDKAYKERTIDYVFGTNLTYRSPELLRRDWFYEVDVSKYIASLISALNNNISVDEWLNPKKKVDNLLAAYNIKRVES